MYENTHKPLPIGIENFEQMIRSHYYYVDKTPFIAELLDKKSYVNLFTRPRRFGKSLNLNMLQYYLENLKENQQDLFQGLKISQMGERYKSHQNAYPVINLTLKGAEGSNYERAMNKMVFEIKREYKRHDYLLKSLVKADEQDYFQKIAYEEPMIRPDGKKDFSTFEGSLKFLSDQLRHYYGQKTVILIDEYDVPLEKAYFKGYYEEMIEFLRSFFNLALKTSDSLEFAVLTGCLRVSRESIFTGINNFKVLNITSDIYGEYFGFTESEVEAALEHYGLIHKKEEVRQWYNGYLFGEETVYNPWSTINYLFDVVEGKKKSPSKEWANSSSNQIIRELIEMADEKSRSEIEALIQGGTVTYPLREDIVYGEIKSNPTNLWSFLFFTGYLKKVSEHLQGEEAAFELAIPNAEVQYIYKTKILEWFEEKTKFKDYRPLMNAIITGETELIADTLNSRMMDIISFWDTQENFYHGFLAGILSNIQGWEVLSNRESGKGRSDIYMKNRGISKMGVIFEFKIIGDKDEPEEVAEAALKQIEDRKYVQELTTAGYRNIRCYGIAFRGKECLVRTQ